MPSDPASPAIAPTHGPGLAPPHGEKFFLIPRDTSRLVLAALALCLIVGLARIGALFWHEPLLALANSYDEVRYSACFDLYPDRPAATPPTQNSPEAPYARYRFVPGASPICYWSTELAFQGAAAGVYHWQAAHGETSHSVRWLGAFKLGALIALWIGFSIAWLRRREPWSALANGLFLPLLFADPANTVYLSTFYAEWTALLALYAVVGLILIHEGKPPRHHAFALLVVAAAALALSKIQHIVLPLGIAVAMLAIGRWRDRVWLWKGKALLIGALVGIAVQVVQLQRDSDAIRAINVFNQADVAFTALLPNASDTMQTATQLGLEPTCVQYSGLRAWQMPGFPADLCPGLAHMSRGRELAALARDPAMALRLGYHGLGALDPWLAPGLGVVAGGDFTPLPESFATLSRVLSLSGWLRALLFGAPFLALPLLLWRQHWRRFPRLLTGTMFTCVVTLGTLTVTVLGDGLADVPKQGHLVFNMAIAWWIGAVVFAMQRVIVQVRGIDTGTPLRSPATRRR